MSWENLQIAIVLALTAVVFFGMVREIIAPDLLAMAAVSLLLLFGILPIKEVLAVFSNSAPFTVACLFILSAALERTGVIDNLGQMIAKVKWRSPSHAVFVVMLGAMVSSAFINNTPIVVIMTPVVMQLAHTLKAPPSKMLIPLSYATILGGTCTLIGTSTNIIVDGVAQRHGQAPFGIFEISGPGLIMALAGIVYMAFVGRYLLPDRQTLSDALMGDTPRKFLTEIFVPKGSPLVGKSLADAGLTRSRGYQVVDVMRNDAPLDPEHGAPVLAEGDRLVIRTGVPEFLGLRAGGGALGLTPHAIETIASHDVRMMEGIVGPRSTLVGRPVADLNLNRLYGAYILAVHRQSENLHDNFGQVRLQFGDTLLLEGPPDGLRRLFQARELVNLTHVTAQPFRRDKAWIAITAVLFVIFLSAFDALPIAATSLIAASAVVTLGCLDGEEAYRAISWPILMLIFGMLAIGTAMESTGAAAAVVDALFSLVGPFGPVVVLSLVYLLTSLLTEIMSNNATGILITPIAIGLAEQMGVDARPFVAAVMFAASASFATPIGYQTNTFVYGAGGYRFLDFTKVGAPLNILLWIVSSVVLPLWWPLTPVAAQ